MPEKIIIATRESQLALWQAEHVKARLLALNPGLQVELLGMTTQGDQILDSPLSRIGGKGLFVKELEVAMEEGQPTTPPNTPPLPSGWAGTVTGASNG